MVGDNVNAMKRKELLRSQIDSFGLEEIIEKEFETVDPEMVLSDIVAKMRSKDLHEIAVVEKKKLLGVVSYGSIIKRKNMVVGMKAKTVMDPPPDISAESQVTQAAELFLSTGYRQIPVTKGKNLVGTITRAGMITILPKIKELKNMHVEDIMTSDVQTVKEDDLVKTAVEVMRRLDIRTLPVVDDAGRLTGIMGIRDIINHNWGMKRRETRGEFVGEKDPVNVKVSSLAVDSVFTIGPTAKLGEAVDLMLEKNVSVLPVLDNNKLTGIISMYDMIELLASFAQRDFVYMQITGLEEEDRFSLDIMEKEIQSGLAKAAKITRPLLFTVHVTKYHTSGNTAKYSLTGRMSTAHGTFMGKAVDWNLIKATVDLMNALQERVTEMKDERLDKKKHSRKER